MSHCHLPNLLGLKNLFLILLRFLHFKLSFFAKDDRGIQKEFLAYLFKKKSTLYINIIKTTLNIHKCLYKIINIKEVKHNI